MSPGTGPVKDADGGTPRIQQSFAVTVTVTLPVQPTAATLPPKLPQAPYPVVLLINGFQVQSGLRDCTFPLTCRQSCLRT